MTAYHDEHENEYDLRAKQAATSEAKDDLVARAREEAAYLESENVSPLSTPTTLRDCADRIASLAEQVEELRNHVEVLQAKIDPDEHCVCGYDAGTAVCLRHSPIVHRLRAENEKMREALEWYAEQVAWLRKLGVIGDPSRHALDADGGKRARTSLVQHQRGRQG